ncbi:hypothetical protein IF2G_11137 [Cordyceps javanica]|nr:hypothetical protein IF2G_11137 [Cordyceps javanica]
MSGPVGKEHRRHEKANRSGLLRMSGSAMRDVWPPPCGPPSSHPSSVTHGETVPCKSHSSSHHCLVVKGICDYSHSHKNKAWPDHTAATVTTVGRALLERYACEDGDRAIVGSQEKLPQRYDDHWSSNPIAKAKFRNQKSGVQAGSINGNVSGLGFEGIYLISNSR